MASPPPRAHRRALRRSPPGRSRDVGTVRVAVWSTGLVVDRRGPLNAKQAHVLQWIADGCPAGAMEGFAYKHSARALQDRHLVSVTRKRGVWRAEITEAGRYYLDHGTYPHTPLAAAHDDATDTDSGGRLPTAAQAFQQAVAAATARRPRRRAHPHPPAEPGRDHQRGQSRNMAACDDGHQPSPSSPRRPGRSRTTPRSPSPYTGITLKAVPMRYKIVISRVQTATRYVRASDEQTALEKVQAELDRPYGFLGGWTTIDTDLDIVETHNPLDAHPDQITTTDGSFLLTVKATAKYLGIPTGTVYTMINIGEIPHIELGGRRYISRDHLTTFLDTHTHTGYHPR